MAHDLKELYDENGNNISPQLGDGIKNYLIDIDGTITEDVPNEEPERMVTCEPWEVLALSSTNGMTRDISSHSSRQEPVTREKLL